MPPAFSRSLRALEADGFRLNAATLLLGLVLLGGWGLWLVFARVSLYAVTDSARLEAFREAHSIEAAVSGRVVARPAQLGQAVAQGDVLVELDARSLRLQVDERTAARAGLAAQLEAVRREIAAQQQALGLVGEAAGAALDEARSRYQEAQAAARFADEQAARTARMHEQGLVSDAERKRTAAEAEQRRAAALALQQALGRLQAGRGLGQSEKRASLAELERQAAELRAGVSVLEATLARFAHELELHQVRAPISGTLGEIHALVPGTEVQKGEHLGSVIPSGELQIVAEYAPSEALGRVRTGQRARMRLVGFPWTQFGSVVATVTGVAGEAHDGKVRVELAVERVPDLPAGLQHGLPGSLEIEVERITPAALVLRAAGRAVSRAGSATGS